MQWDASVPGWDLTRKDAAVYTFGQGAQLQRIRDRHYNSITISRSGGQITQVSSSSGRYVNFTYTGGDITSVSDSGTPSRTVNYKYNTSDALTEVTYTSYDANATIDYDYGYIGDVKQVTLAVSNSLTNKNTTYITYDTSSRHRILTMAPNVNVQPPPPPQPGVYTFTPTLNGSQIIKNAVQLPDQTLELFFFDNNGYLTRVQRAPADFNEVTCYGRNSSEQVTQIGEGSDANCVSFLRTTSYQYNSFDDITNITVTPGPGASSSATTQYGYQTATLTNGAQLDELISVTDPLLNATTYGYDSSGNLTSVTDPTKTRIWNYTYDGDGEVKTAVDPKHNQATNYTYFSPSGDLQSVTDPVGHATSYITDAVGRVTQVTSPAGGVTLYAYDAFEDVTSITDPNGNVTSATYDLLGEIASSTDARGNTTTFTRPYTLNKLTVTDPQGYTTVTNYDASGKKTDQTDRRGVKTAITYDNLRRPTKAVYNSNGVSGIPTRTVNLKNYDALDRVAQITDTLGGNGGAPGNELDFMYDPVDNVLSEATKYIDGSYNASVAYAYDAAGRRTCMTQTPNGGSPTSYVYTYNSDDELTYIYQNPSSCSGGTLLTTLAYDLDGNRSSLTESANGSNTITSYGYDAANRLTSQSFTAGSNALGNLSYTYDADDNLTSETGPLASINLPPSVSAIGYTATNQISAWSNNSSNPDHASNILNDPSNNAALTWDERNFLSSVSGGPAWSFSLQYDAKGRRENDTGAFTGTNYYLDDKTTVVASNNVKGSTNTASSYVTIPGSGEVASYTTGSSTLVPIHDYLGSTLGLVGSSNTLQTQWTYEPYGAPTPSGTQTPYPFLFAGAQYDPTGYFGSYSPRLAHWLSGGAVPYSGQGPDAEFGRMSGAPPGSPDAMGRPSTREAAAQAAVTREDIFNGDYGGGSGGSTGTSANGQSFLWVLEFILQEILGGPPDGGGASQTRNIAWRRQVPAFGHMGVDRGLNVTQAPLVHVKFFVRVPADYYDEDLTCPGCELLPVPLEVGPLLGMAKGPEAELMGRAARRAEQRFVRELAKELGITDNTKAWDWLHDELHELKRLGVTERGKILQYLKEHLP